MAEGVPTAGVADYGLIGDGETAALVGADGSIDWLCWPRFDSDACLAALLGTRDNGRWRIAPAIPFTVERRYRPGTLILETVFRTAAGEVAVTDFMPDRSEGDPGQSHVVRRVEGRSGVTPMRQELLLRFGYGATIPWMSRAEDGRLNAVAGPSRIVLDAPVAVQGKDLASVADFPVRAGETMSFVLTHQASHLPLPPRIDPDRALADTHRFWTQWDAKSRIGGPYAAAIQRSLITLKALIFKPTGGVVAAPTTSLPEQIGGERNWDYRFCWIRDATLTLLALMNANHYEEAAAWRDWLLRAVAGEPADMQIMYGIGGERRLTEWQAAWLPGYAASQPVRIGNAAHQQFQLDVYGELMDTLHQAAKGGLTATRPIWGLQMALVDHVARVWSEPDEGIWEVRGPRRHFTYSKVMAWVAIDRAVRDAEAFGLQAPLDRLKSLREQIKADVWTHGFDRGRNCFRRAYDDPTLDASLLLLAQVGFLAPSDPAFVGTVEAIERELLIDGFVQRYQTAKADDGLPPGEGAFLACSFWLVDAYAMIGRRADAVALFERLLAVRNDLGLLAEEYDPVARRLVGNFPQAFSHIGLINSAFNLTHTAKPAAQRPNPAAGPEPPVTPGVPQQTRSL